MSQVGLHAAVCCVRQMVVPALSRAGDGAQRGEGTWGKDTQLKGSRGRRREPEGSWKLLLPLVRALARPPLAL